MNNPYCIECGTVFNPKIHNYWEAGRLDRGSRLHRVGNKNAPENVICPWIFKDRILSGDFDEDRRICPDCLERKHNERRYYG